MAKKKDAKKDKHASRTEIVRSAVDQAFAATAQATADAGQLTRERATEIADELVGNISRLREALDDARPATAEDIKALRAELATLKRRITTLETADVVTGGRASTGTAAARTPKAPPKAAPSAPARRGAAKPAASAARPSARASASRTAAAKRTSAAAAAAKPAGAKKPASAAAKPKPASGPGKTGAASKSAGAAKAASATKKPSGAS